MSVTGPRPAWFIVTQHWVSLLGSVLIITALISWLFVLPLQVRGHASNPYVGIIVFLALPVLFFAGLALVPIGVYFSKRRIREGLAQPNFDRKSALRRIAWVFMVVTILNILIGTQLTYRAVTYMETPQFCGASCHSMTPELAAYRNSPHSRVECVDCHVAPGAAGWINSKTNGLHQLASTVLGMTPRPIPSALESNRLIPSADTCEHCHSPQHFAGARLRVISKYAEDESNTRTETVLLMLVGGNGITGIHGAHFGPGIHIRFAAADPARQTIPWVEYRNTVTGDLRTFAVAEPPADSAKALSTFEMQCVDCHNRPTHTFDLPERAMDKALAFGDLPATLPFIKREGVELLRTKYNSGQAAADELPLKLGKFYQENYPELYTKREGAIRQAAHAVLAIYQRNVFPELNVSWGTYPNNLGHTDFPGCFRCHDGGHATADGKVITQDCNNCHEPLATDETNPDVLRALGLAQRINSVQKP